LTRCWSRVQVIIDVNCELDIPTIYHNRTEAHQDDIYREEADFEVKIEIILRIPHSKKMPPPKYVNGWKFTANTLSLVALMV
jgi:hypothetical protein